LKRNPERRTVRLGMSRNMMVTRGTPHFAEAPMTRWAPTPQRVPALVRRGEVWLSEIRRSATHHALRACITNVDTTEADVRALAAALERERHALT
jgi:hypothetical protein